MAETSRSQLIQQQLENLLKNAPPPVTQAEREQIMKGRDKKGQAEIDKGRAAIDARAKEVSDYNEKIDRLNTQLGEAQTEERTAAKETGDAAERKKREDSSSPLTQKFAPFVAGAGVGGVYGELANRTLDKFERGNAQALKEIGEELGPTSEMTNSQMNRSRAMGAAAAAEKFAPAGKLAKALTGTGRALSYGIPAAAILNEYERYRTQADDEKAPWADRQGSQQIANGLLGAGTGIAVEGGRRFFFPHREEGAGTAMARIEAARDYAKRMDTKDATAATAPRSTLAQALTEEPRAKPFAKTIDAEVLPEPTPQKALPAPEATPETPSKAATTPGTAAYMRERLKDDFGITGTSKMKKGQLASKLAEAMQEHGAKRTVAKRVPKLPGGTGAAALAGGLAYALTPDRAEAAGGAPAGAQTEALTNAGVAGGTAYGVSKLAEALRPAAGRALGTGLNVAGAGLSAYDNASEAQGYRDAQPPEQQASPFGQLMPHAMPLAIRGAQDINSITSAPGRLSAMLSRELSPRNEPPSDTEVAQPGFMGPDAIPAGAPTPPPEPQQSRAGPPSGRGMIESGNIDLTKRPQVRNPDGSISTVRSMSANFDGREVLLPTVSDDGRILGDDEAVEQFRRTGKHLGMFDTPENATSFAEQLHKDQERFYPNPQAVGNAARSGPMMQAAALELPQNVDPEATLKADIASGMEAQQEQSPFPAPIQGRLGYMIKNGAPPEKIAEFLNAAMR